MHMRESRPSQVQVTSSQEESTNSIETAVPLCYPQDAPLPPSSEIARQQPERIKTQPDTASCCCLCTLGALCGMFVTALAYGSMLISLDLQVENNDPKLEDDGLREHIQHVALLFMTHVADLSYVLICFGFAWILTSNGNLSARRWLNKLLAKDDEGVLEDDQEAARTTFVMIVILEGGFLVGGSFQGLVAEIILGMQLSLAGFASAVFMDVVVCCLLIWFYDWGLATDSTECESEETTSMLQQEEEKQFYIAIV